MRGGYIDAGSGSRRSLPQVPQPWEGAIDGVAVFDPCTPCHTERPVRFRLTQYPEDSLGEAIDVVGIRQQPRLPIGFARESTILWLPVDCPATVGSTRLVRRRCVGT